MPLPLVQAALVTARKVLVKDVWKSGAFLRFGLNLKSSREEKAAWFGSKRMVHFEFGDRLAGLSGYGKEVWKSDVTLNICIKMCVDTDWNAVRHYGFLKGK